MTSRWSTWDFRENKRFKACLWSQAFGFDPAQWNQPQRPHCLWGCKCNSSAQAFTWPLGKLFIASIATLFYLWQAEGCPALTVGQGGPFWVRNSTLQRSPTVSLEENGREPVDEAVHLEPWKVSLTEADILFYTVSKMTYLHVSFCLFGVQSLVNKACGIKQWFPNYVFEGHWSQLLGAKSLCPPPH